MDKTEPKYWEVDLHYNAIVTEIVEADTQEEAIQKAIDKNGRRIDDVSLSYSNASVTAKKPHADEDYDDTEINDEIDREI